jgi:hypothetical protein
MPLGTGERKKPKNIWSFLRQAVALADVKHKYKDKTATSVFAGVRTTVSTLSKENRRRVIGDLNIRPQT